MHYDVFNGDADGILSLVQMRLEQPKEAVLITGVKRDISLLKQVPVNENSSDTTVTVLDISMEKNIDALRALVDADANVFYADHHRAGDIPESSKLDANINLDPDTCTALIVDKILDGRQHLWAIAAAYGDNLIAVGDALSKQAELSDSQAAQLKELGTLVNYNGYGETLDDLHFSPSDLFKELVKYKNPFECVSDSNSVFYKLGAAYQQDLAQVQSAKVIEESEGLIALELNDAPWARRISGVYGNQLANDNPNKAILVLTKNTGDTYRVSLRAPINNKQGAGDICSQFETGGGRAAAAGINELKGIELSRLIETVQQFYLNR